MFLSLLMIDGVCLGRKGWLPSTSIWIGQMPCYIKVSLQLLPHKAKLWFHHIWSHRCWFSFLVWVTWQDWLGRKKWKELCFQRWSSSSQNWCLAIENTRFWCLQTMVSHFISCLADSSVWNFEFDYHHDLTYSKLEII